MRPESRVSAVIEVLETIHSEWSHGAHNPADNILSDYFKQRRYMGSKDRRFVADLVYFILRYGSTLEWWLEQCHADNTPRQIVMMALVLRDHYRREDLEEIFSGKKYAPRQLRVPEWKAIEVCFGQPLIHESMPAWAAYSYPEWLEGRLMQAFNDTFHKEITALNTEAPLDMRTNTLKCPDRSDLIMALDKHHYYCSPTPHSPLGVRLNKRAPVFTTDIYKDGWFEVQDEGSQLVAALVGAKPGQKVVDFCAGAGGKTLAIAAQMQNKGDLLAWDINEPRLKQMHKRLKRAEAYSIIPQHIKNEQDDSIKHHYNTVDWVLVDAPCSGSGTWRRNPDLKWRITPKDLSETLATQKSILHHASKLVKPGGSLVYATCSLFEDENENQVKEFLVDHPDFRVEDAPQMWNNLRSWREGLGSYLRLTPHKDGTDGFFAAIIKRL